MTASQSSGSLDSLNGTRSNKSFAIVGAGMAGILSAIKLIEAGFSDIAIFEKADEVGGTWRENRYPGVACDVPSHLYCYSFEQKPDWSHVFSSGSEIFNYFKGVAIKYGIYEKINFGCQVTQMRFKDGLWHISTDSGKSAVVNYVIAATGVLHHPKYPEIDGIGDFKGDMFHTARWPDGYSLKGKRVGIVGTGSSAVQIVASSVDVVDQLYLFQRTPQWVLGMPNDEVDAATAEKLKSNPEELQKMRNEISDTFTAYFADAVVDADSPAAKMLQDSCIYNLEFNVPDPELREKLRPDYKAACKRLIVSPNFYQAISKINAHLITDGISKISDSSVILDTGESIQLDTLVLATGFKVDAFLRPMDVYGDGGTALDDLWNPRPYAYMSIMVPKFPNLFMLNGPNGPVGNFSLIDVAEIQVNYCLQLIREVSERGADIVEPKVGATEDFESRRVEATKKTVWVTGCKSWYLDDRGVPSVWPWTMEKFREDMATPVIEDFIFDSVSSTV
jgi:cation diffusion facilitator CzcD-associated flavoprotein CzcO